MEIEARIVAAGRMVMHDRGITPEYVVLGVEEGNALHLEIANRKLAFVGDVEAPTLINLQGSKHATHILYAAVPSLFVLGWDALSNPASLVFLQKSP